MLYSRMSFMLFPLLLLLFTLFTIIIIISCTNDVNASLRKDDNVVVGVSPLNDTTIMIHNMEQQQPQHDERKKRMLLPIMPNSVSLQQRLDDKIMKYNNDFIGSMTKRHSIDLNNNNTLINDNRTISINETDNSISLLDNIIKRQRKLQNDDLCVTTEEELRKAILNAPNFIYTVINICISMINIVANVPDPLFLGINIQYKNLYIQCYNITTSSPCIINAQGLSRHFYVNQSNIIFHNIIFYNGYAQRDITDTSNGKDKSEGGSLLLYKSNILFDVCQFLNNIGSNGGAIASITSNITFTSSNNISNHSTLFENNTASKVGGAIYAKSNTTINATIGYFIFRNNYAGTCLPKDFDCAGEGGAIYVERGISFWSNGIFDHNRIPSRNPPFETFNKGGAIYFDKGAASFTNVTFQNNVGDVGGAVSAYYDVEIMFINSTFSKNYANQYGGAYDCVYCLTTFVKTNFIDNSVSLYSEKGGGAVNARGGSLSLTDVIFQNNTAPQGAAVEANELSVSIINVKAVNNTSTNYGTILIGNAIIKLNNSVFKGNIGTNKTTRSGAIVYWDSTLSYKDNIFLSKQLDTCDTLAINFNKDDGEYRETCFNFPSFSAVRRRLTIPKLTIPNKFIHSQQRSLASTCVTNCIDLRGRAKGCNRTSSRTPCRINVCSKKLTCSSTRKTRALDDGPIDISNKDIIFNCTLDCPSDRCELDGGGDTQLFSGSNLTVSFIKFNFTNSDGSAIQIFGGGGSGRTVENSVLNLSECSFVNNSATSGSAISVNQTDVFVEGSTTSFINNMGNGAPFDIFSSDVTIRDAYFEGNNISEFGSGIRTFDSTVNFGNISFAKAITSRRRYLVDGIGDCDMYVVVDINNFKQKASCLTSDGTIVKPKPEICSPITIPNVPTPPTPSVLTPTPPTPTLSAPILPAPTLPAPTPPKPTPPTPTMPKPSPPMTTPATPIPPSQTPPTQALPTPTSPTPPTPTPPPPAFPTSAPTRPNCFSGWNIVEVKDVGSIRMNQLQIGDFVKSGNGQFTQVYGFGHLDPALEEVFLQIHFDRHSNKQADFIPPLPLEVSAQHLVMLDKIGLQYPIRASDVVAGDMFNGLRVRKIQNVVRRGVYAPLTQSGDLIVSDIRASSYIDVLNENWGWNQHVLGHMIFFPQRIFCSCFIETCKKEGYINGYGYLSYLVIRVGSVVNRFRPCALAIVPLFLLISIVVFGIFSWLLFRFGNRLYFGSYQLKKK